MNMYTFSMHHIQYESGQGDTFQVLQTFLLANKVVKTWLSSTYETLNLHGK